MVHMGCIKGDEKTFGASFWSAVQCYFLWLQGAILSEGPEKKRAAFPVCRERLLQGPLWVCVDPCEIVRYDFFIVGSHEQILTEILKPIQVRVLSTSVFAPLILS